MSMPPKLTSIGSSRTDIPTIGPRPSPFERTHWRARDDESPTASLKGDDDRAAPEDAEEDIRDVIAPRAARTTIYIVGGVLGGVFVLVLISMLVNSIMDFKLTNSEAITPPAKQAAQTPPAATPSAPTDQDFVAAQRKLADALTRMNVKQQAPDTKNAEQAPAASAPDQSAASVQQTNPPPAATAPPPQQTAKVEPPPQPVISADEVSRALVKASSLIREGQVSSARALLERAAQSNDPSVAFALAETWDPKTLARWKTIGIAGDVAKARALYKAALDGGVAEAQARLDALDR
jgi:hypothetical protein